MQQVSLQPTHDLVLSDPANWRLDALAFAPDGRLYAEVSGDSFNLWAMLVFYWPEVLGAFLGLLLLWLAWSWLRTVRRPQTPGSPHCRRCGYDRSGLVQQQRCPECDSDPLRNRPLIGRRRLRRLAVPLCVAAIVGVAYGGMYAGRVPRRGSLSELFSWPSPRLAALAAETKSTWLLQHRGRPRRLVEIDPVTGSVVRTVRRLAPISALRLSISPDSRTAVTTLWEGELTAIDLASGRVRRRQSRLDDAREFTSEWSDACWRHVAGWIDARRVCVQFLNGPTGKHEAFSWDVDTGELTRLADVPLQAQGPTIGPPTRLLYMARAGASAVALEVPARIVNSNYGAASTIRVRDLSDAGSVVREITDTFWGGVAPVFGVGGADFYIRGWGGADIMLWSVDRGVRISDVEAPGFMGTLQDGPAGLAYHAPTKRLFVATADHAVHVREGDSWVRTLDFGFDGLPDDYVAVSPDGRWVCIGVREVIGGLRPMNPAAGQPAPGFKTHLMVFDMERP